MLSDLRFAFRRLRHAPGFTAIAILTIAVAVGANTAILSIADAVLFRPLPYQDADRVFVMMMRNPVTGTLSTSVPDPYLRAIDERHGGLSRMGTYQTRSIAVQDPDGVRTLRGLRVSYDFFDILGVTAARGRLFAAADRSDSERPAVLSYAFWQSRFGGDPGLVGRQITLGTSTFDVIGVLPAQFIFPANTMGRPDVVTLLAPNNERARAFYPIFRVEPGITHDQAQAEIGALIAPIKAANAAALPWLADLRSTLYPTGGPIMQFLLAAAVLVLLLGCANLANLLLARARTQERETALRSALGGSRLRIVRGAIIEALIVALTGASIAVIVNVTLFDALLRQVPRAAYLNAPVGVSGRVMALSFALALAASLLFAALPIWRSTRSDVRSLLGRAAERRARTRLGAPMVAVQIAIAVVLLFGAAMATRAFVAVIQAPLGFDPARVVAINVPPPRTAGEAKVFYRAATEALTAVPGVISVGATAREPLISGGTGWSMISNPPGTRGVGVDQAMPGYLETLGVPLLRGRLLTWDDAPSGRALVLSESASRSLFGTADPLGRPLTDGSDQWEVVGVVGDVRISFSPREPPNAYTTGAQTVSPMRLNVRVTRRTHAVEEALAAALRPLTPVAITFDWWEDGIAAVTDIKNPRFQTMVLTSFAAIALGLTAIGLFGLVTFLVVSRTRELGIRIAIGASPKSLSAMTMRQMLWPVMIGLVAGLVATRLLAKLAEAQLFKVDTRDPATLAVTSAVVLLTAMLAAYLPARRAERIDPIIALRTE